MLARTRSQVATTLALAWLPLAAGCGARSTLSDAPSATPASACPAALAPGAAAPMVGICSTRTFRSAFAAPTSPRVAWTAQLGGSPLMPAIAVDAAGTAYVAQQSPADPSVLQLLRVDPPGDIAWTRSFDGSDAGAPILGADGDVRVVHLTNASQPELLIVDPGGSTVAELALPDDSMTVASFANLDPAVGADGSLYLAMTDGASETGRVTRVSPTGALAWSSATYDASTIGLALGRGDTPYALVDPLTSPPESQLIALSAGGASRWTRELPGLPVAGPAIRDDGRVVVLTGDDQDEGVLWVLSPDDGSTVWSTSTGVPAGIWIGVAPDGTIVFVSANVEGATTSTVTGVDAAGHVLWHRTLDGDVFYRGALDASGLLLLAAGDAIALDVTTGATRWTLAPPSTSCAPAPLTVSTDGVAYGVQCDGTFFAASD